eukprot:CAMPEP_0206215730 /NCGR_PEP_ID=MMETSP0047_2-20121206/2349_1 /ASSEMBLY_ACC=CAM_ASM_000192 /TAXON_ID=195065 /ORGANISM="Chroomonas mesostigmatica_cf, Strain CCMP1168" /LENGTH=40 /DNA_ID= /DNA_START= /DNA_END= /DNA_ORIENTATION=
MSRASSRPGFGRSMKPLQKACSAPRSSPALLSLIFSTNAS